SARVATRIAHLTQIIGVETTCGDTDPADDTTIDEAMQTKPRARLTHVHRASGTVVARPLRAADAHATARARAPLQAQRTADTCRPSVLLAPFQWSTGIASLAVVRWVIRVLRITQVTDHAAMDRCRHTPIIRFVTRIFGATQVVVTVARGRNARSGSVA